MAHLGHVDLHDLSEGREGHEHVALRQVVEDAARVDAVCCQVRKRSPHTKEKKSQDGNLSMVDAVCCQVMNATREDRTPKGRRKENTSGIASMVLHGGRMGLRSGYCQENTYNEVQHQRFDSDLMCTQSHCLAP